MKLFLLPFVDEPLRVMNEVSMLPDNVIINSGKQLFEPYWLHDLAYTPVVLVRMSKVARFLEPQYTNRYYEQVALGISFVAQSTDEGIPDQLRYSFDDSMVRGDVWHKMEEVKAYMPQVSHVKGAKLLCEDPMPSLLFPDSTTINESIALISRYSMLKIGDMIAFPLWRERRPISENEGVFITDMNKKELLYCGVK